jgi:hypothetical protein
MKDDGHEGQTPRRPIIPGVGKTALSDDLYLRAIYT